MEKHRCWAEIDLGAIRHNAGVARKLAGPGGGIMAIVKANAYGHGLPEVVHALPDLVAMYGVANVREARAVRETLGSGGPGVFILGAALPEERAEIVAGGFVPAISSLEEAAAYVKAAGGKRLAVHLAIDTGMGRMGVAEEEAGDVVEKIARLPALEIAGVATHLPVADGDLAYTRDQLRRFEAVVKKLRATGIDAPVIHALNSAGVFRFPPDGSGALARVGLTLYGSSPIPELQKLLRPALALKTRVIQARDLPEGHGISYGRTFITPQPMRVATLAIGYADGYERHLSGQGADVLIRGKRCPLLGRVTMDQIMVDVSEAGPVGIGEEAVLIGKSGDEEILAGELADKAGTIAWEIFTSIGARVDRVY